MKYDRALKDVVMCAQKEYLHGVGIAKVIHVYQICWQLMIVYTCVFLLLMYMLYMSNIRQLHEANTHDINIQSQWLR